MCSLYANFILLFGINFRPWWVFFKDIILKVHFIYRFYVCIKRVFICQYFWVSIILCSLLPLYFVWVFLNNELLSKNSKRIHFITGLKQNFQHYFHFCFTAFLLPSSSNFSIGSKMTYYVYHDKAVWCPSNKSNRPSTVLNCNTSSKNCPKWSSIKHFQTISNKKWS